MALITPMQALKLALLVYTIIFVSGPMTGPQAVFGPLAEQGLFKNSCDGSDHTTTVDPETGTCETQEERIEQAANFALSMCNFGSVVCGICQDVFGAPAMAIGGYVLWIIVSGLSGLAAPAGIVWTVCQSIGAIASLGAYVAVGMVHLRDAAGNDDRRYGLYSFAQSALWDIAVLFNFVLAQLYRHVDLRLAYPIYALVSGIPVIIGYSLWRPTIETLAVQETDPRTEPEKDEVQADNAEDAACGDKPPAADDAKVAALSGVTPGGASLPGAVAPPEQVLRTPPSVADAEVSGRLMSLPAGVPAGRTHIAVSGMQANTEDSFLGAVGGASRSANVGCLSVRAAASGSRSAQAGRGAVSWHQTPTGVSMSGWASNRLGAGDEELRGQSDSAVANCDSGVPAQETTVQRIIRTVRTAKAILRRPAYWLFVAHVAVIVTVGYFFITNVGTIARARGAVGDEVQATRELSTIMMSAVGVTTIVPGQLVNCFGVRRGLILCMGAEVVMMVVLGVTMIPDWWPLWVVKVGFPFAFMWRVWGFGMCFTFLAWYFAESAASLGFSFGFSLTVAGGLSIGIGGAAGRGLGADPKGNMTWISAILIVVSLAIEIALLLLIIRGPAEAQTEGADMAQDTAAQRGLGTSRAVPMPGGEISFNPVDHSSESHPPAAGGEPTPKSCGNERRQRDGKSMKQSASAFPPREQSSVEQVNLQPGL